MFMEKTAFPIEWEVKTEHITVTIIISEGEGSVKERNCKERGKGWKIDEKKGRFSCAEDKKMI